jgi:hypothetical protein
MNDLTKLGIEYNTDKVDQYHNFLGDTYTDIYYKYLNHLRDKEFNFLEIGVRDGQSVKMWSEFFPKANIIGVDINPSCKQYEENNIAVHIGSQEDEVFLNSLIAKYGSFRVVLDDGSHINSMTMKSFKVLQNLTTEFYIIEDLRNSYEDLTKDVYLWPGMNLNKDLNADNSKTRPEFDNMFLNLIKQMDYRIGNWSGFYFHAQMLLMQKGKVCKD